MTLSREVHESREWVITQLRGNGLITEDIAYEMELDKGLVTTIIHGLIRAGKIEKLASGRRPGSPGSYVFWRDLGHPKTQLIIDMVKVRATQDEIAKAIGVTTRERARQLIEKMEYFHGPEIWRVEEKLYFPSEAAEMLTVTKGLIYRICREENIPWKNRGKDQHLLSEDAMEMLRNHPRITGKRKCVVCQKEFFCKSHEKRRITCSKECAKKKPAQWRKDWFSQKPSTDSLHGHFLILWQRLKRHAIPKNETWLLGKEACKLARISRGQIYILGRRGIIATKEHTTRKRLETPVVLYSASQMKVVRQVYQEYLHQQQQKGAS